MSFSRLHVLLIVLLVAGAGCAASGEAGGDAGPASGDDASSDEVQAEEEVRDTIPTDPRELGPVQGEFGLWVRYAEDSLRSSWLTAEEGTGFFEALSIPGEAVVPSTVRSSGFRHTAALALDLAEDAEALLLRYGRADDPHDLHETRIRLDPRGAEEAASTDPHRPPAEVEGVDSLYVVSDVHGEYDSLTLLLRAAGLVDEELRWAGGESHLVMLGDMVSRGDHATAVLWFFYRLEEEARQAGGRVHVLLGNHELMVMMNDLRYVQPKELALARSHGVGYDRMFDPRHSVLGRWLVTKPAVLRVDEVLLAHGGVSADYLDWTPRVHRDSVGAFLSEDLFYHWDDDEYWEGDVSVPFDSVGFERRMDYFSGDHSPLWHREYLASDTLGGQLEQVLDAYEAGVHVVGHTPLPRIQSRYGGRLIAVNTIPFAAQILLLVRDPEAEEGYLRYRIGWDGEPEAF